jgi:hypothetical protein
VSVEQIQIQTDSGSDAKEGWPRAICLALAVVYGPFFVAAIATWFIVDSNPADKRFWLLCVWVGPGLLPFAGLAAFGMSPAAFMVNAGWLSALMVGGTACLAKRGGVVQFLSLVNIGGLSALLALGTWAASSDLFPGPRHFQDVDHIPDDVHMMAAQLDNIQVDHVYFFKTRVLRCDRYFRCHIVRKADFERYRDLIRRQAAHRKTTQSSGERDDKTLVRNLSAGSGEFKAMRSWWDWPDRSDCEVLCIQVNNLVAFDPARHVVYIAESGD